jgi:hypothetical protein
LVVVSRRQRPGVAVNAAPEETRRLHARWVGPILRWVPDDDASVLTTGD